MRSNKENNAKKKGNMRSNKENNAKKKGSMSEISDEREEKSVYFGGIQHFGFGGRFGYNGYKRRIMGKHSGTFAT